MVDIETPASSGRTGIKQHTVNPLQKPNNVLSPDTLEEEGSLSRIKVEDVLEDASEIPQNSPRMVFFLLVNTMIGSGILNQPEVFAKTGMIGALLMLLGVAYITWYGVHLIVAMTTRIKQPSYQQAVLHTLGPTGENIYLVSVIIMGAGALISYITIVGGTASQLFISWGCQNDWCDVYGVTGTFVPFFVLPLCLFRHYGHLSFLSTFSFFSICMCVMFVLFAGPTVGPNAGYVEVFRPAGLVTKLGSVVFALTYASSSFMGYLSLENRSQELYDRISGQAVVVGALLCLVMGMAGYGSFRSDTDGEILDNFTTHAADPFKILLVAHLIMYIPVDAVVTRDALVKLFITKDTTKDLTFPAHFALTFALLAICTMVVLIIRDAGLTKGEAFSAVLDITGSIGGAMLSFTFPALMFLKVKDPTWPRREAFFVDGTRKATILLVFGIIVMVTVPSVVISQL